MSSYIDLKEVYSGKRYHFTHASLKHYFDISLEEAIVYMLNDIEYWFIDTPENIVENFTINMVKLGKLFNHKGKAITSWEDVYYSEREYIILMDCAETLSQYLLKNIVSLTDLDIYKIIARKNDSHLNLVRKAFSDRIFIWFIYSHLEEGAFPNESNQPNEIMDTQNQSRRIHSRSQHDIRKKSFRRFFKSSE